MIYGFNTDDESTAIGSLLIYAIYRSRDRHRFRATPDMWAQIERFVKAAAKRADTLWTFIDGLKPRLCCGTINPRWMAIGAQGEIPLTPIFDADGKLSYTIQLAPAEDHREFLTGLIERADHRAILNRLYRETQRCVLHVRDRLERERPIEDRLVDPQEPFAQHDDTERTPPQ